MPEMMPEGQAAAATAAPAAAAEAGLLDQIVHEGRFGRDEAARDRGRGLVRQFVDEVLKGTIKTDRDTEAMINARIRQIDELLSRQLDAIVHAPEFQRLEASWRGLRYLLDQSETSDQLKIKVLNVSKKDLLKDLEKASEFDQSTLFKKVYEEEFGQLGGAPFGALIGDYEFDRSAPDMSLLERVAQVAAAAHAPFLTAASAEMFNLDDFTRINAPRDMSKVFDTVEYAKWKSFRQSDDSRYVALTVPRMLMRLPYGPDTKPVDGFDYKERVDADHEHFLWANAAWALGARVTQAFAQYGWCACIRGVEGGGLVEGLPTHVFTTDEGDVEMKCPTEVPIPDRREKELADQGFVPLIHRKGTDQAAFLSVQSAQKAKVYDDPAATANARISAQLPYLFAVSRFAHFLKVMMRDKLGSMMSRDETEAFLNRWINNYVVANSDAGPEAKAKRPLKQARIDVQEIPGRPGAYRAIAFLQPHFQLDELSMSMRLVAELPQPAK
jgi:type VI secretion system protein ImpC